MIKNNYLFIFGTDNEHFGVCQLGRQLVFVNYTNSIRKSQLILHIYGLK